MDPKKHNISLDKRHVIQKHNKSTVVIVFTTEQDVFENEEHAGTNAYECYIYDDENDPSIRAIYYYNIDDENIRFIKYYDYGDDTMKTITIYRMLPMEPNDTVEETLARANTWVSY